MTSTAATCEPPTNRRKTLVAVSTGHAVEWYDFAIYAFLAPVIATVFFPAQEGSSGLLATFAVFAVAFFFRPLGGFVFGGLGDRFGRRVVLTTVIAIMAFATFLIGLLPGYAVIGPWAPALLVVIRILQGLSAGGEYGGAATFLAETSDPRKRGRYMSWVPGASYVGQIAASVLILGLRAGLTEEQFNTWGWRVPFLLALPIGLIALYMRLKLEETPEFRRLQESGEVSDSPVKEALLHDRKAIFQTIGLVVLVGVGAYMVTSYLSVYLSTTAGFTSSEALWISTATMITLIIVLPIMGTLSDRIGRRRLMIAACATLIVISYPIYFVLANASFIPVLVCSMALGAVYASFQATAIPAVTELFSTRRRYSGFSIGYNISLALFGGTASYVATFLIDALDSKLAPSALLIAAAVVTLLTVLSVPETAPNKVAGRSSEPLTPDHDTEKATSDRHQQGPLDRRPTT